MITIKKNRKITPVIILSLLIILFLYFNQSDLENNIRSIKIENNNDPEILYVKKLDSSLYLNVVGYSIGNIMYYITKNNKVIVNKTLNYFAEEEEGNFFWRYSENDDFNHIIGVINNPEIDRVLINNVDPQSVSYLYLYNRKVFFVPLGIRELPLPIIINGVNYRGESIPR